MPDLRPIKIICGPTASGKTSVALNLAEKFPLEIISADSRQIVKHLNIGTAKPTEQEQESVPFHLIDVIEPGEKYSAFRFLQDADILIGEIIERGKIPLVVGGTGLYLKALSEGVAAVDRRNDEARLMLQEEMERVGPEIMHKQLAEVDPVEAARIHPNNRVRVIRALEIFRISGRAKSELIATGEYFTSRYTFDFHCLMPDRSQLYNRINSRVDRMVQDGLVEEFLALVDTGLQRKMEIANVIGYSELISWLGGELNRDEAIEKIKQNSRRFAKRQITWFRHQTDSKFYPNETEMLNVLVQERV